MVAAAADDDDDEAKMNERSPDLVARSSAGGGRVSAFSVRIGVFSEGGMRMYAARCVERLRLFRDFGVSVGEECLYF